MPLAGELLRLVEQSVWANRQWIEFVFSQPDPEPRPLELLGHIVAGEQVWFDRVEDQPQRPTFPSISRTDTTIGDNSPPTTRAKAASIRTPITSII